MDNEGSKTREEGDKEKKVRGNNFKDKEKNRAGGWGDGGEGKKTTQLRKEWWGSRKRFLQFYKERVPHVKNGQTEQKKEKKVLKNQLESIMKGRETRDKEPKQHNP